MSYENFSRQRAVVRVLYVVSSPQREVALGPAWACEITQGVTVPSIAVVKASCCPA